MQVASEAPNHSEPIGPPPRIRIGGTQGPVDGKVDPVVLCSGRLGIGDEVSQELAGSLKLVTEGATGAQGNPRAHSKRRDARVPVRCRRAAPLPGAFRWPWCDATDAGSRRRSPLARRLGRARNEWCRSRRSLGSGRIDARTRSDPRHRAAPAAGSRPKRTRRPPAARPPTPWTCRSRSAADHDAAHIEYTWPKIPTLRVGEGDGV